MTDQRTLTAAAARDADVLILDCARTPLARPGGALHEVQPSELLAGLMRALHARFPGVTTSGPWPFDAMWVGSLPDGPLPARALSRSLARADAPILALAAQLEGTGAEAILHAAAQLRSGGAGLALAGGIHLPSRQSLTPDADVLGGIAARSVAPRVAADVLAALEGVTAETVKMRAQGYRDAGIPAGVDDACIAVRDLNGLAILVADDLPLDPSDAKDGESWANHHVLARQVHPTLAEIASVHTAATEPPPAEGACLLLLARADAARSLGQRARGRLVAAAAAGHLPLRGREVAAYAFARALARAGWSRDQIDILEVCSRFAGVPPALARALGIDIARVNPAAGSWWHAHAGAASSAIALQRLLQVLEQEGQHRGALVCTGAEGQATVLLVERGNDD